MARKNLAKLRGRHTFTAKFVWFSEAITNVNGMTTFTTTVLLENVADVTGKPISEHMWLSEPKLFEQANLKHGDKVKFTAEVSEYTKAYAKASRSDYTLTNIKDLHLAGKSA